MGMQARVIGPATDDELFDMANLSPARTGLPMVVWISERGRARQDARVKVSQIHGRKAHPDQTVSLSVRPTVEIVAGTTLDPRDLALIRQWIELNRDLLLAYWEGEIFTDEVIDKLVPVGS
jgi:hypothetical protein